MCITTGQLRNHLSVYRCLPPFIDCRLPLFTAVY